MLPSVLHSRPAAQHPKNALRRFAFASLGALALAGGAALADPVPISRTTTTTINPGSGDFSGATVLYQNTFGLDSSAGSYLANVSLRSAWTRLSMTGSGGTTLSFTPPTAGATLVPTTVTSPGGSGQSWDLSYSAPASNVPGASFISTGQSGGFNTLIFGGGGSDLLAAGGVFLSVVQILGDWSSLTSHTPVTYNSAFTVLQDFVYDSVSGYTTFSLRDDDYVLTQNPNIAFSLIGNAVQAVPEPSTLALLGAAAFGFWMSRRQRPQSRCKVSSSASVLAL